MMLPQRKKCKKRAGHFAEANIAFNNVVSKFTKKIQQLQYGSKISMGSILMIMGTIGDKHTISLIFGGIFPLIHMGLSIGLSIGLSDVLGLNP
jgi:phosphotransferase system HPr-like phosphotransfer protein